MQVSKFFEHLAIQLRTTNETSVPCRNKNWVPKASLWLITSNIYVAYNNTYSTFNLYLEHHMGKFYI